MLARSFVSRPNFAWIFSTVILLIGGCDRVLLPFRGAPPTLQVTASYPGANAQMVEKNVAAPIEQQVNGVEQMISMSSHCTDAGEYQLTITFESGTDLNEVLMLVQNRVAIATPQLPEEVRVQGISITKNTSAVGTTSVSPSATTSTNTETDTNQEAPAVEKPRE